MEDVRGGDRDTHSPVGHVISRAIILSGRRLGIVLWHVRPGRRDLAGQSVAGAIMGAINWKRPGSRPALSLAMAPQGILL